MASNGLTNKYRDDFALFHAVAVQAARDVILARSDAAKRHNRRSAYHAVRVALAHGATTDLIRKHVATYSR